MKPKISTKGAIAFLLFCILIAEVYFAVKSVNAYSYTEVAESNFFDDFIKKINEFFALIGILIDAVIIRILGYIAGAIIFIVGVLALKEKVKG